jgi:hypothetical protein
MRERQKVREEEGISPSSSPRLDLLVGNCAQILDDLVLVGLSTKRLLELFRRVFGTERWIVANGGHAENVLGDIRHFPLTFEKVFFLRNLKLKYSGKEGFLFCCLKMVQRGEYGGKGGKRREGKPLWNGE